VIVVVPTATPVAIPVVAPTGAMAELALAHVPPTGVPDKAAVPPSQIVVGPDTDEGDALTVIEE
jgi:hypothetical protein